jgi:hypothetical protein
MKNGWTDWRKAEGLPAPFHGCRQGWPEAIANPLLTSK